MRRSRLRRPKSRAPIRMRLVGALSSAMRQGVGGLLRSRADEAAHSRRCNGLRAERLFADGMAQPPFALTSRLFRVARTASHRPVLRRRTAMRSPSAFARLAWAARSGTLRRLEGRGCGERDATSLEESPRNASSAIPPSSRRSHCSSLSRAHPSSKMISHMCHIRNRASSAGGGWALGDRTLLSERGRAEGGATGSKRPGSQGGRCSPGAVSGLISRRTVFSKGRLSACRREHLLVDEIWN